MGLIGCHVSISGGIENAPQRATEFGCESMQVFTANQKQWTPKPISEEQVKRYKQNLEKSGLKNVISHNSYLTNLGGFEEDKVRKSIFQFEEELKRCELLEIPYLVFHPGSHLGKGIDYCLKQIATNINKILQKINPTNTKLLLENTAGQGTNVGFEFEHLRKIIDYSEKSEKFGICFDTCHGFQAGYDIRSKEAYHETFQKFDDIIGLDLLKVFHLNDAKFDIGLNKDRHQNIGKGFIGLGAFARLMQDDRFAEIPMILETPNGEERWEDEIKVFKSFRR